MLLGNGDGSFQAPLTQTTGGFSPIEAQVGDFNADGIPDVMTGNNNLGVTSAVVLLGNGDGTLQPPSLFVTPLEAEAESKGLEGGSLAGVTVR